ARTRSSVRRNQRSGSSLTAATVETSIQTMFSASVLTEASAGSDDGDAAVRASTRSRDDDPPVGQTGGVRRITREWTADLTPPTARRSCPTNGPLAHIGRHCERARVVQYDETRNQVHRSQRGQAKLASRRCFPHRFLAKPPPVQTTATQPPGRQPVHEATTRQWGKPSVFDPLPAHRPPILPHQRAARPHRPALRTRTRSSVRRNPQSGSSLTAVTVKTSIQTMFSAPVPI